LRLAIEAIATSSFEDTSSTLRKFSLAAAAILSFSSDGAPGMYWFM
jgi:hypothetical protein